MILRRFRWHPVPMFVFPLQSWHCQPPSLPPEWLGGGGGGEADRLRRWLEVSSSIVGRSFGWRPQLSYFGGDERSDEGVVFTVGGHGRHGQPALRRGRRRRRQKRRRLLPFRCKGNCSRLLICIDELHLSALPQVKIAIIMTNPLFADHGNIHQDHHHRLLLLHHRQEAPGPQDKGVREQEGN